MPTPNEPNGFQEDFLGEGEHQISLLDIVNSPKYSLAELKDDPENFVLDYQNFSLIMDKQRKFPIITASNIDGTQFKKVDRKGSFKKDGRMDANYQWGSALYSADKSKFDKGHMTKREDVQWGYDEQVATEAAESTFFYTNSVPQHARLNRAIWRSIESYVLKSETVKHNLKVVVLTGPVLQEFDPDFVTSVKDQSIKIPILFWKIIYYKKNNGELFRTAFLVSQKELLEKDKIVKKSTKTRTPGDVKEEKYFLDFKKAETYQVTVDFIKELTDLNFPDAGEDFSDERPNKLILKEVNARGESGGIENNLIKNLVI